MGMGERNGGKGSIGVTVHAHKLIGYDPAYGEKEKKHDQSVEDDLQSQ